MKKSAKKRAASILLFVAILMFTISICSASVAPAALYFQYTTTAVCNVRTEATTASDILTVFSKGYKAYSDIATVNYVYSVNRWTDVTASNGIGWVRNDLLCPSENCYAVSTTAGLNLRAGPSTSHAVMCALEYGTYVEIISIVDSIVDEFAFVRVRTGDYEEDVGYVSVDYIRQV